MWLGPLSLMHVQDRHPAFHAPISILMEAFCFPLIFVCGCFVLFERPLETAITRCLFSFDSHGHMHMVE